jgi:hypothetical protein
MHWLKSLMPNPNLIGLNFLSQHLPQRSACGERFVPILQATPRTIIIARESRTPPQSKNGKGALPASKLYADNRMR